MLAYVFPGQGSQKVGMGAGLFDEFSELTAKADEILGYSIRELCLEDHKGRLGNTQYTQPALYVVSALSYLKILGQSGCIPDYVAGHSLGEYNALFAAGVMDFENGLKLVKKRGELMSRASGGGMAAVIGLNAERIREILDQNGLDSIDIANYNTKFQTVISGMRDEIERVKPIFEAADENLRMYSVLAVSGAFHSRYMTAAQDEFAAYLEQFELKAPKIPVISNVHARPYKKDQIKDNLIQQITHSVKWCETIRYLLGRGEMDIVQVGPGNVLSSMTKYIRKESEPIVIPDESSATESGKSCGFFAGITPESLGSSELKKEYGLRYAYMAGSMYKGVSSKELVVRMGKAGMLGFFGSGGVDLKELNDVIEYIKYELQGCDNYGMNLLNVPGNIELEEDLTDLYLRHHVRHVEASAYITISPALVRYRLSGIRTDENGNVISDNKIMGKVSRPEVAEAFMSPAPKNIVDKLLSEDKITDETAKLSQRIPMADDICVEADSAGHTDQGVAYVLMPAICRLREEMMKKYGYKRKIRIGAAGGIGTPEAAAAAFMLGADFILTGSVNQCTVEAGTSDAVKYLLQDINVQDTEYAPAGDMFELGAKVQVLKKGLFFPARANKLYELYRMHNSIDEIDEKTRRQIEEKYFKRSFDEVYNDVKAFYPTADIEKAERMPKYKMALIFRWYFGYSTHLALNGSKENKVDYQVHCGPALGAFNQWIKDTPMKEWSNRHADEIGIKIMQGTADLLNARLRAFSEKL